MGFKMGCWALLGCGSGLLLQLEEAVVAVGAAVCTNGVDVPARDRSVV
jgi:hypothetical protein